MFWPGNFALNTKNVLIWSIYKVVDLVKFAVTAVEVTTRQGDRSFVAFQADMVCLQVNSADHHRPYNIWKPEMKACVFRAKLDP